MKAEDSTVFWPAALRCVNTVPRRKGISIITEKTFRKHFLAPSRFGSWNVTKEPRSHQISTQFLLCIKPV